MVIFPNCKINIGLDVLRRRADSYHDIDTLMYPVMGLYDALEIIPHRGDKCRLHISGISVDCPTESNIVYKAWKLMNECYGVGAMEIRLHKAVPFGAGLGGGSADGAFTIKAIDSLCRLALPESEMERIASRLGSDVPFFIRDTPALCTSRGEVMTPFNLDLSGVWLSIIKPSFGVSTAQAYRNVTPSVPEAGLRKRLEVPIEQWRETIKNDFEQSVFEQFPRLAEIKRMFYDSGATYASMSGSGSAMYGLFRQRPRLSPLRDEILFNVRL